MSNSHSHSKILVVDDEAKACSNIKRVLEQGQYSVEVAHTGQEALCKIQHFEPHVILLDIIMPGLTGIDLVKMIKAWKPEIEIVIISAVAEAKTRKDCLEKGAFACIEKPINLDDLEKVLKAIHGKEKNSASRKKLTEADMLEIDLVMKLLERKKILTRNEVLEEVKKIRAKEEK